MQTSWGKSIPSGENSKCEGPGVRMSWLCSFWKLKMGAGEQDVEEERTEMRRAQVKQTSLSKRSFYCI